jgi:hypothetical protein
MVWNVVRWEVVGFAAATLAMAVLDRAATRKHAAQANTPPAPANEVGDAGHVIPLARIALHALDPVHDACVPPAVWSRQAVPDVGAVQQPAAAPWVMPMAAAGAIAGHDMNEELDEESDEVVGTPSISASHSSEGDAAFLQEHEAAVFGDMDAAFLQEHEAAVFGDIGW